MFLTPHSNDEKAQQFRYCERRFSRGILTPPRRLFEGPPEKLAHPGDDVIAERDPHSGVAVSGLAITRFGVRVFESFPRQQMAASLARPAASSASWPPFALPAGADQPRICSQTGREPVRKSGNCRANPLITLRLATLPPRVRSHGARRELGADGGRAGDQAEAGGPE